MKKIGINLKKTRLQEVMGKQHASLITFGVLFCWRQGLTILAGLGLAMQTKQSMKSQKSTCFCLPGAVTKGVFHDIGPLKKKKKKAQEMQWQSMTMGLIKVRPATQAPKTQLKMGSWGLCSVVDRFASQAQGLRFRSHHQFKTTLSNFRYFCILCVSQNENTCWFCFIYFALYLYYINNNPPFSGVCDVHVYAYFCICV